MSNLAKTPVKIDSWVWANPLLGLLFVMIHPAGIVGWFLLNLTLLQMVFLIMIIPHELGHAVTARFMGMSVLKIILGYGRILFTFRFLGLLWEIKRLPSAGFTLFSGTSTHYYRFKLFLIILFGPFTNGLLILLALQFPQDIFLSNIPGTYLYPGIAFYMANGLMMLFNLYPSKVKTEEGYVLSDGLQLLSIPWMSKQEVDQKIALSYCLNGQDWEHRGNHEKALESFNQAIQKDPLCVAGFEGRGRVHRARKHYLEAIEDCNQVIQLAPQNALAYFFRGMTYFNWSQQELSKLQSAIQDFSQAIALDSQVEAFYYFRAASYSYLGDEINAIADFSEVIQLNPSADAYYNRGVIYYHSQNYPLALMDLDRSLVLEGNNVAAYYNRGNAKYVLEDELGACEDYKIASSLEVKGSAINAQDEHGFYARGVAHSHLKSWDQAKQAFQITESLCLEHGNRKLLQLTQDKLKKIENLS